MNAGASLSYRIVRRLAAGGMGEVLLAEFGGSEALGITPGLVVVKRTLPDHPNRAHQNRLLREEGRIAVRLRHGNLVETFALDDSQTDPVLIMEYLPGRSMAQVLGHAKKTQQMVPVDVGLQILRGAACGLHFAHTLTDGARPLGLVHRDVSPANIFVTFDGRVKVIDFGVAKADDSEIRTSTGILKGKIGYMSPEHSLGEKLDARADIWSLGVFFWESLLADRLFTAQNPAITLHQIASREIEPPSRRRKDIPPAVDDLCMRMLSRDLSTRVQNGVELVQRIDACAVELSKPKIPPFLKKRFPADARQGAKAAKKAARSAGAGVPSGLVDGTTRSAEAEAELEQRTLVTARADLMKAINEIEASLATAPQGSGRVSVPSRPPAAAAANQGPPVGNDLVDDDPLSTVPMYAPQIENVERPDRGSFLTSGDESGPNSSGFKSSTDELLVELGEADKKKEEKSTVPVQVKDIRAEMAAADHKATQPIPMPVIDSPYDDDSDVGKTIVSPMEELSGEHGPPPAQPPAAVVAPEPPAVSSSGPTRISEAAQAGPPPGVASSSPDTDQRTGSKITRQAKRRWRRISGATVGMTTFGVLAIGMGLTFATLKEKRQTHAQVVAYANQNKVDVIVARMDAPVQMQPRALLPRGSIQPEMLQVGPNQVVTIEREQLVAKLKNNGVYERALLPQTRKELFNAAFPMIIMLLGMLALGMGLPGFVSSSGGILWSLRSILMLCAISAGYVFASTGLMSWPGFDRLDEFAPSIKATDLVDKPATETPPPAPTKDMGKKKK